MSSNPQPVEPMRHGFREELDQLRLQVELMGVRVDENLERMREGLRTGDPALADLAFEADNEIDAMNVSLTERCYLLLGREAPVASDLRFVVSVLRIISELERVGDLALRVVKLTPKHDLLHAVRGALRHPGHRGRRGRRDVPHRAAGLVVPGPPPRHRAGHAEPEPRPLLRAPDGRAEAPRRPRRGARSRWRRSPPGRALERIADHSAIIGARLRYLITGEPAHLAAEVR